MFQFENEKLRCASCTTDCPIAGCDEIFGTITSIMKGFIREYNGAKSTEPIRGVVFEKGKAHQIANLLTYLEVELIEIGCGLSSLQVAERTLQELDK